MNTDIKLVALDLDRTTLNSESHLSEVNRQALIDAISNGVHVCIASGRAFDTLPEDVISVPGIEYAITSNGAAIYRIAGKECLKSYVLTPESVKTILKLTENDIVTYEAFIKGQNILHILKNTVLQNTHLPMSGKQEFLKTTLYPSYLNTAMN